MNTRGPCTSCGSPLAIDQRYCVQCGQRVGPPLAMPYAPATPAEAAAVAAGTGGLLASLPMPLQTATTLAALALGFGVVAGTAISPDLASTVAGTVVVQQAPPPAEPIAASDGGGSGGGGTGDVDEVIVADETLFTETEEQATPTDGGETEEPKAEPTLATGVVVHVNPVAQSYTLSSGSFLTAVHTTKALPALGARLKVPVRDLANLTAAEDGKRRANGQAAAASFSGIVTFNRDSVDPAVRDVYTVSGRGTSILVHSPLDITPGTANTPPPVGTILNVTVAISDTEPDPVAPPDAAPPPDPGAAPDPVAATPPLSCAAPAKPLPDPPASFPKSLYETAVTVEAAASEVDSAELEAVVQAGCGPSAQLLLSADDVRESEADLFDPATGAVISAVPGIDLTGFTPGEPVVANVTLAEDADPSTPAGTKAVTAITGIRSDRGAAGADQQGAGQGDLRGREAR